MRYARATLIQAAMATTSLIIAAVASSSATSIIHQSDDELQQELLYLTSILKEISNEQSWSSDTLPLSSDGTDSFSSFDEEEVSQWMERKEMEVQNYYTTLLSSEDGERRGKRSSIMAAAPRKDDGSSSEDPHDLQHHHEHFVKMDERRQLRIVPTGQQSPPNTEEVHRELGKGVGMKRTDLRAAGGRFTPMEERTPPKGREKEPPSDNKVSGSDGDSSSSLERGPQEGGVLTESSEDESSPPRTPLSSSRTQGGTGSRWSHVRKKSAKSMKHPPPPPPPTPPKQQFPNAVYVQQPPPQQQQQQDVAIKHHVEVEECYDMEELTAMGLMLNIQSTQDVVMVQQQQQQQQQQQNQVLMEEQHGEIMTATTTSTTRSNPPVYRYDGTLINQKPGSRRSLQYYPYNYWTWGAAKTVKSAKNAQVDTVYVTQSPPQPQQQQVVYVGQQQQPPQQPQQQSLPPPPPLPSTNTATIVYLNSKSAKSKSSKMGKMTKSGKVCIELPPPTPPFPSICGTTLATASTNCDSPCTTDADCPEIMDVCIPNVEACAPLPTDDTITAGYCGITEDDASSKCAVPCVTDAGCPISGESCFTSDSVIVGCSFGYCGVNVLDAGKCVTECSSDADCPGGEGCYSQGSIGECSKLGYCGTSALDASKCAVECTSSGDCPGGESCWSQGNIGGCATSGYCGADLDDASKCANECTSDGDCPGGESCFTGSVECKPGFCGTDGDDATKCKVPCSSDLGCSSGETCFTGVKCVEETRCPSGCKDCDPDSPLPCPNPMMKQVCDKQNDTLYPPGDPKAGERISNFRDCYDMCKPSFCCIHSSLSKEIAPTCAKEYENCPLYYPCYIIWWKLHDTIGPAPYLRVEQKEPFFNVKLDQLESDFEKDPTFFNQLFGHHFDTDDPLTDDTFEDPENW